MIYTAASHLPGISLLCSVSFIPRAIKHQQTQCLSEQAHCCLHLRQPEGTQGQPSAGITYQGFLAFVRQKMTADIPTTLPSPSLYSNSPVLITARGSLAEPVAQVPPPYPKRMNSILPMAPATHPQGFTGGFTSRVVFPNLVPSATLPPVSGEHVETD